MLQVRKSRFCGISAIFFQCYFMNETLVLMAVSNFFCFFSRIISRKEVFLFNGRTSFLCGGRWGASALIGGIKKINVMSGGRTGGGGGCPPQACCRQKTLSPVSLTRLFRGLGGCPPY